MPLYFSQKGCANFIPFLSLQGRGHNYVIQYITSTTITFIVTQSSFQIYKINSKHSRDITFSITSLKSLIFNNQVFLLASVVLVSQVQIGPLHAEVPVIH